MILSFFHRLLQNNPHLLSNEDLVSRVTSALHRSELFEQAGQLYEKLNQRQKALDCYRRGHAYARAVELSRQISPSGKSLFVIIYPLFCYQG